MSVDQFRTVPVLGSGVHVLSLEDAVGLMKQWIEKPDGECHRITVTGFHGLWKAHVDRHLRSILNSADLWIADGIAPVLIARLRGISEMTRIPGAELMEGFLGLADDEGYRSFFYGDTEKTLAALKATLMRRYPGHQICGMYSPPFRSLSPEEEDAVVHMINDSRPDVVWVGLGMPKQDIWVYNLKDRLNVPVAIGIGAAFRFHAGNVKRVPKRVGDFGFEWLWRLAMEPKKLWRRDLIDGPQFLCHVAMELLGLKRYDPGTDHEFIQTK